MVYTATGSRKQAISKVKLAAGNGNIKVNNLVPEQYFQYNFNYLKTIKSPLVLLNLENNYDVEITVSGGGLSAQADATRMGIAKALCNVLPDSVLPEVRSILRVNSFLTRDSRSKERKKYGLKKARKSPQFSKR